MSDIAFTPTFKHTDYIDNRDRVQASGPNGFNIKFQSLLTDLAKLHDVVDDVNAALKALGQGPDPVKHTLTLSPALAPVAGVGAWAQDVSGVASRSGPLTNLGGVQSVSVPHGAKIGTFRTLGQNSGTGTLRVSLLRSRLLTTVTPADRLARITGDTNPFDLIAPVDVNFADVDTTLFRYFVLATLDSAANSDTVTLSGFQVVYTA